MEILPAIDLRGGRVVRLAQGDYDRQTVYSENPAQIAADFADAGVRYIHVVDLDAARTGQLANLPQIRQIAQAGRVKFEVGGGIRNDQAAASLLEAGADRVIVGSAALKDWAWFEALVHRPEMAGRVALGLDAREGRLAVQGWTEQLEATALDLARQVRGWPLGAIIYTDIARDGMLTGPNVPATAELIEATDVPVIASGGVSRVQDIVECRRIGCAGAIIGRAYYEGQIDLAEALAAASGK